MTRNAKRYGFLVAGLLALLVLGLACAKAEKAAAPAPTAPEPISPAPAAKPAPASTPAPAPSTAPAPAREPAPSQAVTTAAPSTALDVFLKHPDGQPLVPGGPPLFTKKLAEEKGVQFLFQYHQTKLPLWTKAVYGGEFRVATPWIPTTSLNFLKFQVLSRPSYAGMLLLFDMGRCSMVGRDADFSKCAGEYGNNQSIAIIPGVFQSWEQLGPTTYVFRVRKGVLWPAIAPMNRADREITAEDIAWFLDLQKTEGILKDNFQLMKAVEAVDRYTVKVTMLAPHFEFLRHMANSSMGLFPKECYEEKGCLGSKQITPGPFLIKEHVAQQRVLLEKNPEFHLKGLPYADRWLGLTILDPQAQKSAFLTGQTDAHFAFKVSEMEGFKRQMPNIQIHSQAVLAGTSVLRPQLKGPLADVRVRRAMAMAMDHRIIWEGGYEGFAYFANLVSRDYFGVDWYYTLDQAGQWYRFNPAKAKQLLTEAGYPEGFKLPIVMPQFFSSGGPYDAMVVLQSNWKKHLGIDVKILFPDPVGYANQLYERAWDGLYYQYGWNISYWAEGETALSHFTKGQRLNLQSVDDSLVTELYPKVRSELDPAKRTTLLWQFEQHELDQIYLFRIAPPTSFVLMQPWEMNGVSHQVAWWCCINGPSWLNMQDVSKQPKR